MHGKVFEVVSVGPVKGHSVHVRSYAVADTREGAVLAHAEDVAVVQPASMGKERLVIRIERKPGMEQWASELTLEALERAKHDSKAKA